MTPFQNGPEVPPGVRQQAEGSGEFRSLKERVLVIGLELENLLVDSVGSREKALRAKAVGDADKTIDRLVNPTRPERAESPSVLVVAQSPGWSSATRAYSSMAASRLPWRNSFSAFRSAAAQSNRVHIERGLDLSPYGVGPGLGAEDAHFQRCCAGPGPAC